MNSVRRFSSADFLRSRLMVGAALGIVVILLIALTACADDDEEDTGNGSPEATTERLTGTINGDGSSTVFPITEAVAEEFGKIHDVQVTVGISGTGGGFQKFCNGETDFNDASRPIKDDAKEAQACAAKNIEYEEFQVAFDGLSVVTNPANDFVDCLTVEELANIWKPDSTVKNWSEVRAGFPDKEISLYGPGTDSGTFDYFTSEIVGEEGSSRADYTASENDDQLVAGVAGDSNALGYFGFAYYEANQDTLKLLGVDNGSGCIQPARETILDGTYSPLSRPLFVYVTKEALQRPEVAEFMRFYLTEGPGLVQETGYVEATEEDYEAGLAKLPPG